MKQDDRLHKIGTSQGLAQAVVSGEHSCPSIHAYVSETSWQHDVALHAGLVPDAHLVFHKPSAACCLTKSYMHVIQRLLCAKLEVSARAAPPFQAQ